MEQQTISIAKAGIHATLNARTSILAAANPVGGRYNRKATLRANINMSAPIMSRFDLFFVVLDECNEDVDRHLASHIVNLHMLRDDFVKPEFSTEQLQRYIRFARTFKPVFTPSAKALLVQKYKDLRANDSGGLGRNSYRITVRQLESLIRLSEAIAKANCVEEISDAFVIEAYNLLRQSIISVERDDVGFDSDDEDDEAPADNTATNGEAQEHENEHDADSPMADAGGNGNGYQPANGERDPTAAKPRTKISAEKYTKMSNFFIRRLAEDEEKTAQAQPEAVEEEEDVDVEQPRKAPVGGIDMEGLIVDYLEGIEDEVGTEEEMARETKLARKVLKRMERNMEVMVLQEEEDGDRELNDADGEEDEDEEERGRNVSRRYVLHPNVALEEL